LFLQCDSRDGVSLFDQTSGVSTASAATANSTVRSQWTTRDAVACLAVRSHLLPAEGAHFGQYKTAQSLYNAVVARYSSPATAALSRLMLPYLFPDLAAFATVADLITHLRTSDALYRAALPTEFSPASLALVAVSLADPSGGLVLAHSSTILACTAAPSGLLLGLHLPSFSTNLVSRADLQDAWVGASSQVFAAASRSSPASAPCSCRPLSHETLLWHHRLGHPSLPRLRGMASRTLVSGLPRSLPPLPLGPAPTCVPCVKGRQRAAPHSSSFPPTEAPLQTLQMDIKGEVPEVLIDWIRGTCRQLSERFSSDLPILRLHSDRGGEFSSDLLRAFCRAKGIRQTFTLLASPQQNEIVERRIGMVMDVARTSMIHASAPHFLWPFAVQYAAHHMNLQPCISLPETTPTLRWTGKVGDASAFRVWGSRAFVRDTSSDKLSSRSVPCVILGFPPDAPGWQFYHPTSRRVLSSQDVTFDESVLVR
ncbi:unnamed protein product, partial [Closterium sp. NIES-53]